MPKSSPYGPQMTWREKRRTLKDRYYLIIGPMLLILSVSVASSDHSSITLTWVTAVLFAGLTINRILP